jgi:hypothetical protein
MNRIYRRVKRHFDNNVCKILLIIFQIEKLALPYVSDK